MMLRVKDLNAQFFVILAIKILCGAEIDLFLPSFPELKRVLLSDALQLWTVSFEGDCGVKMAFLFWKIVSTVHLYKNGLSRFVWVIWHGAVEGEVVEEDDVSCLGLKDVGFFDGVVFE